jgi:preprotein translocase subunit SecA
MSTTTQSETDIGFLERLSDGLNAFSDGVARFLTRLLGSSNERLVRKLGYIRLKDADPPYRVIPGSILARVNELEPRMRELSNEELRSVTPQFRQRLANGEPLENLLPETFAACRESGRRYKDMRHFDVQILGGTVLHEGKIAEMVTGEGKTLVATLPAVLNALTGKGVHIVTVNDYLARRDCEWMTPIYQGVGMAAGYIQSDMDPVLRRKAYDCDITYGTNSEFGFDYLRDNMKPARWSDPHYPPWQQQCQKMLNFAIIDEVDNILVDEARTPLIISGSAFGDINRFRVADRIARQLQAGTHFEIKEKEHTCHLTEDGIHAAERLAGVESFYTAGNMEWPHLIDQALKAHHLYKRDKNYVVMPHPETREMSVIIVDEFTGRLMVGRQWSDGLHQAVEAKEGVPVKEETQTLATVTLQNFFKLYKKLAGMTGTAMTEANEFWKIYKLEVVAMPTNKALHRINSPDVVYRYEREKWQAILDEIERVHKWDSVDLDTGDVVVGNLVSVTESEVEIEEKGTRETQKLPRSDVTRINRRGRPILVGTTTVEKSEKLGELLKRKGIKFELLNAKPEYAAREAEIVAQAGRLGAVTISTNMAGRGTDIILGGNPEFLAWAKLRNQYETRLDVPPDVWKKTVDEIEAKEKTKEEGRKVAELGGLHIVGTERHEARRIDNQLRGRSGRQGDPGSSRFFVSLQDDLMRIFAGEWVAAMLTRLGMEEGQAIESPMVSRRIEAAQKKVEERNFDIRKNLLEYDEVMDHQRKRVYGYRQEILEGANCKLRILEMLRDQVSLAVDRVLDDEYGAASFAEFASNRLSIEFEGSDFVRTGFEEAERFVKDKASRQAVTAISEAIEENLNPDADPSEWNWEALAKVLNKRWEMNLNARQLKALGRDHLLNELLPKAEGFIQNVNLSAGEAMLQPDFGRKGVCDWARLKFGVTVTMDEIADKEADEIKALLSEHIEKLYHQKEIEFPVQIGLASFLSEGGQGHVQRHDRDGLCAWAKQRFPDLADRFALDDFRTGARHRIRDSLLDASKKCYPENGWDQIEDELDRWFAKPGFLTEEAANELAAWAKSSLRLDVEPQMFAGQRREHAQQVLLTAFDIRYRPEMRAMERSLVLSRLDTAWKDHLYAMDHLRQGIGLVGYAQVDPKTEYKREGMKMFDSMWERVQDEVSDLVFKMEEAAESFADSLWMNQQTVKEQVPSPQAAPAADGRGQPDQAMTNSGQGAKKVEPIRNRTQRVGRNDPCPCGSGKKYKNCCMRTAV